MQKISRSRFRICPRTKIASYPNLLTHFKRFQKGELTKNRIEALSDGIFAVVLTLLVLEIKLTHGGLSPIERLPTTFVI